VRDNKKAAAVSSAVASSTLPSNARITRPRGGLAAAAEEVTAEATVEDTLVAMVATAEATLLAMVATAEATRGAMVATAEAMLMAMVAMVEATLAAMVAMAEAVLVDTAEVQAGMEVAHSSR